MNRNVLALFAGMGLLAASASAQAQEAEVVEGPGYPVGEGTVIHPTVGAELGVINNVFYEDVNPYTSGLLRLVASASLGSKEITPEAEPDPFLEPNEEAAAPPAAQKLIYRAGGKLTYDEYLSPDEIVRAQRTLSADFDGHLVAAPEGTFSFTADEHFLRATHPANYESFDDNNRIANNLALAVKYQPGGRQIVASLGWQNQIDFFEDSNQRFANRMINGIHGRGEWKWLPYTKFYADASVGFISGFASTGADAKRSAMPIRGGIGVATAIVETFTIKAHAGWAYASYSAGEGYNRPVLGLELGYRYSPMGRVVVEYNWDHRDSINANYYRDHHLGAHIDQQFDRVVLGVQGEVRFRGYRGIPASVGAASRDDLIFSVGASAQYVLKDWMSIVGNYRTDVDQTSYMSIVASDDPSYIRNELTAGVRAAF